ncbi:MAG: hypothetical protein Q4E53_05900 [Eubacteriales bacterium]|nr:hypothetical protein [Eubacteriales bacterium]
MKRMGLVICLLTIFAVSIATGHSEICETPLRYSHTDLITAKLSIINGSARCGGILKPSGSENQARIIVRLQRKTGNTWQTIAIWLGTGTNGQTVQAGGLRTVTAGYDYRVVSQGKILSPTGVLLETTTVISPIKSY